MFPEARVRPRKFGLLLSRQRGAGLPMAIFLITVMALVVVTIAQLQETTGEMESLDIQSARAFYAAESGAQLALTRVIPKDADQNIDPGNCTSDIYQQNFSEGGLAGCSARVDCEWVDSDEGIIAILSSTGSCGSGLDQSRRQIEVRAQ